MALVVIPFAGLKPLTHGVDLEACVLDCPVPSPALLQAAAFICELPECISYGVWPYMTQDWW